MVTQGSKTVSQTVHHPLQTTDWLSFPFLFSSFPSSSVPFSLISIFVFCFSPDDKTMVVSYISTLPEVSHIPTLKSKVTIPTTTEYPPSLRGFQCDNHPPSQPGLGSRRLGTVPQETQYGLRMTQRRVYDSPMRKGLLTQFPTLLFYVLYTKDRVSSSVSTVTDSSET